MPGQKFSHGRGGAGNISSDDVEYVDGLSYSPPVLSEKRNHHYTTGIGGAGNIRKYNADEARVAQDVPEGPFRAPRATAAGRGGYGNLREFHKRERHYQESLSASARTSEESNVTVASAVSNASRASSIGDVGFANWSKHLILGSKV